MTLFDLLNLRSEWEEIVRGYKFVGSNGNIETLEKFIESGHRGNRFRDGFDRAMEIAKTIVSEYNENFNIPGVYWKAI